MDHSDNLFHDLRHLGWIVDREENFFELLATYLSAGAPLGLKMGAFRLWVAFGTKTTAN